MQYIKCSVIQILFDKEVSQSYVLCFVTVRFSIFNQMNSSLFALFSLADATGVMSYVVFQT